VNLRIHPSTCDFHINRYC